MFFDMGNGFWEHRGREQETGREQNQGWGHRTDGGCLRLRMPGWGWLASKLPGGPCWVCGLQPMGQMLCFPSGKHTWKGVWTGGIEGPCPK